jgi:hypothetical protein
MKHKKQYHWVHVSYNDVVLTGESGIGIRTYLLDDTIKAGREYVEIIAEICQREGSSPPDAVECILGFCHEVVDHHGMRASDKEFRVRIASLVFAAFSENSRFVTVRSLGVPFSIRVALILKQVAPGSDRWHSFVTQIFHPVGAEGDTWEHLKAEVADDYSARTTVSTASGHLLDGQHRCTATGPFRKPGPQRWIP